MLFKILLLSITFALCADMRIAHLDSRIIFERFSGTLRAQEQYDKKLAKWEQEANLLQKEVVLLEERLEKQSLLLSEEKRLELGAELSQKRTSLKNFVNRIYGPSGELMNQNSRVSQPLVAKIRETVNKVAREEGYDLVLDRASGALIYWKDEHDLTQRVLIELNRN